MEEKISALVWINDYNTYHSDNDIYNELMNVVLTGSVHKYVTIYLFKYPNVRFVKANGHYYAL